MGGGGGGGGGGRGRESYSLHLREKIWKIQVSRTRKAETRKTESWQQANRERLYLYLPRA